MAFFCGGQPLRTSGELKNAVVAPISLALQMIAVLYRFARITFWTILQKELHVLKIIHNDIPYAVLSLILFRGVLFPGSLPWRYFFSSHGFSILLGDSLFQVGDRYLSEEC